MRRWLALAAVVLFVGCGGGDDGGGGNRAPVRVDWDLTGPHTLDQVDWPKQDLDLDTTQLRPVESVRIRLPAKQVLKMGDQSSDVTLYRRAQGPDPLPGKEGRVIEQIEVSSAPLTVDAAYKLALSYTEQFGLERAVIDEWRKRRKKGVEQATDRTSTGNLDKPLAGKGSPIPNVELLYSANDKRPWVVMVQLYWPKA